MWDKERNWRCICETSLLSRRKTEETNAYRKKKAGNKSIEDDSQRST